MRVLLILSILLITIYVFGEEKTEENKDEKNPKETIIR